MFIATQLIGFGASGGLAPQVSYLGYAEDTSDVTSGNSYTFASQPLGAAAGDRYIIVTLHASPPNPSGGTLTIAGVSATWVTSVLSSSGGAVSRIAIAAVPSGTTGDIVFSPADNSSRCSIGIFRVVSLLSGTAHATATANASSSGIITTSLNVPANGFVISAVSSSDGTSWTWTAGAAESYDSLLEGQQGVSGATQGYSGAQTSMSVTATCGTGSRSSMATASWGNG